MSHISVDALAIYAPRKNEIGTIITGLQMLVMDGPATIRVLLRLNLCPCH